MDVAFIGSMFALGLVTSIHCVFMCGPLVLTYAVKGTEKGTWVRRLVPHLAYQGAKIVSYATVALVLAGLVTLAGVAVTKQTTLPVTSWAQVVAGAYMVLLGISMSGKVPFLRHLTPRPPKFLVTALSRERKKATSDAEHGHASLVTPIVFGLLTGLMPCGPLIGAQVNAAAQGSITTGVLGMFAFGLGTTPLMIVFGFASSLLSRRFQAKMQVMAAIGIVLFGLVILNRGLMLVDSPVTFDSVRIAIVGTAPTADPSTYPRGADGVVEVPIAIVNTAYVPDTVRVPALTPVRLVVDRQEDLACSDQLVIRSAGIQVDLTPNGKTLVDLPPMPAGTYQMTCQMGMMSGTLLVGSAATTGGGAPWLLGLLGVGAAGLAYGLVRRKKGSPRAEPNSPRSPAPASPLFLGFTPIELALGIGTVVVAIIIGLASGGFFK